MMVVKMDVLMDVSLVAARVGEMVELLGMIVDERLVEMMVALLVVRMVVLLVADLVVMLV